MQIFTHFNLKLGQKKKEANFLPFVKENKNLMFS
jgi:hypothetical protein